MTLTFFHTAPSNETLFRKLLGELAPEIPARHIVRADLLNRAVEHGSVTPEIAADTEAAMRQALGDDTAILLCTCSTIGGCADQLHDPRVLRVDRPMAQRAIRAGPRVLVAACVASTVEPTVALLQQTGPHARIESLLMADLWPVLQAGDTAAYWRGIADRLRPEAPKFDSIVLAQASMAGAAELLRDLSIPVLASPRLGLQAAIEAYHGMSAKT